MHAHFFYFFGTFQLWSMFYLCSGLSNDIWSPKTLQWEEDYQMEYEKNIYTVWQTLEKNLLYAN